MEACAPPPRSVSVSEQAQRSPADTHKQASDPLHRWTTGSSSGQHFNCLDGLRGVAIVMVVAYHSVYCNPKAGLAILTCAQMCTAGWMGVPLFFVLSGFLISYPMFRKCYHGESSVIPRRYALRRAAKIIPPFYLSLVVFAIGFQLWKHVPGWDLAFRYALGIPNFIYDARPFNGVYWSLIVETHFYIALPLLFLLFRRRGYMGLGLILTLLFFLVPLVARCVSWKAGTAMEVHFLMSRFPGALDYFAWGILFAWLFAGNLLSAWDSVKLARLGYVGLFLFAVSMAVWAFLSYRINVVEHLTFLIFNTFEIVLGLSCCLLLFFVLNPSSLGAKLFSRPEIRITGIISYEWFLFHQPVVVWVHERIGSAGGSALRYALIVGAPVVGTYVFAALLYRYFSLPIMKALR
jgi:peptidoglycan/LPS O-acetylase OafA/YrhL